MTEKSSEALHVVHGKLSETPRPSVRLLGARIDCVSLADVLNQVLGSARYRLPLAVMYVNIHCMNVRERDSAYRAILESADLVYCDGTGVRLAGRLVGLDMPPRMTGADWIWDLCRMAVGEDLSLFLLGSVPGVAEAAAQLLTVRFPGLRIVGTASGYTAGKDVIERVNAAAPDVLLVGMGTPTQEKWIASHGESLDVPVIWAVGALFDFVSGRIPRGPRWMTEHGLEWLCRLAAEPRKLWRRYLIGNPLFFFRVLRSHRTSRSQP